MRARPGCYATHSEENACADQAVSINFGSSKTEMQVTCKSPADTTSHQSPPMTADLALHTWQDKPGGGERAITSFLFHHRAVCAGLVCCRSAPVLQQ